MKIAVLGANGMLGARVVEEFVKAGHDVFRYVRSPSFNLAIKWDASIFATLQLDWVVNCAGIVKTRASDTVQAVLVNAAMPHWLEDSGCRVLQISTDCVFSGGAGNYAPTDNPDPVDLYGASKLAGELRGPNSMTVRTSFIGWENGTQRGLLEWLIREKSPAGYVNALWSGLSAREVARALVKVVEKQVGRPLGSLHHLAAAEPISKYELLCLLVKKLHLDIDVVPVEEPHIDRTLNGWDFEVLFGYDVPSWEKMAEELARERPT